MTYTQRLNSLRDLLKDLVSQSRRHPLPSHTIQMGVGAQNTIDCAIGGIDEIAEELSKTPTAKDGGEMKLLASFPYPHTDDRDRMRVALYDKPTGEATGEYIIWTETRESFHDGFREPSRFWGHYFGYMTREEQHTAHCDAMIKLSQKLTAITGPYREAAKTARLFKQDQKRGT